LRFFNVFFIIVFVLLLALPLVFVDLEFDRISVTENRMLAPWPKPSDIKNNPGRFVRQFDEWFKDSTGFRERLVAIYKAVNENKWLNNNLIVDGNTFYLIGEEGHHYFAGYRGYLIPIFQGKKKYINDDLLSRMAKKLEDVKIYLENKGIPLVVMFCAVKESIYPEFYPKLIKRGPEPIQLDVITKYLQENTSVDIFSNRQTLLAEKNKYMLFYVSPGDLHHNEIAAFFTYRELMKHINAYFPQIIPYEPGDIEINNITAGWPYPFVTLKSGFTYQRLNPSFFDDIDVTRSFTGWEYNVFYNMNSNLPTILVLGDSFAQENYICKYIAQQFGKTIFIHHRDIPKIQEYINLFQPDIVVLETNEHGLSFFSGKIIGIPELP
jgi:hypothetical protein